MKSPDELIVPVQAGVVTTALVYRGDQPPGAALILAHGAGAPQRSPWIVSFSTALASRGLDVITFNFLYTEQRRKLPDKRPILDQCYRAVIDAVRAHVESARTWLFIGGKSMGGRIATHVAADDPDLILSGLVPLGYPLHPPGRPDKSRDAHLPAVKRPMLFVQGSRDAFGTPGELEPVLQTMEPRPALHVVAGGDHSFKVTGRDPGRQAAAFDAAQSAIVDWIAANRRAPPDSDRPL